MSKNKRLLIVSYYYPPVGGIGLPGCMRAVKFIKYLKGWDISVLTVHPEKYSPFLKLDNDMGLPINNETIYYTSVTDIFKYMLRIRNIFFKNKLNPESTVNNTHIDSSAVPKHRLFGNIVNRFKSKYCDMKDFVHDILNYPDHASSWIPNAVIEGIKITKKEKPDVIFATGMPWSALVIANILHRFTSVPYICDFRDPWVGNPFHKSKGSIFDALDRYIEGAIIRDSALVTANTLPLKNQIMHRNSVISEDKVVELPNGFDPDDVNIVKSNIKHISSEIVFKIVHAGFLYGERNPIPILKALRNIYENNNYDNNEIKFIQIGTLEANIQAGIEEYVDSGYALCVGQISHHDCMEILSGSDLLVIIQQGTDMQIPSKIYEYISLGRPIITITRRGGALWDLVEGYKFGDLFDPDDIIGITNKIQEHYIEKKKNGFQYVEYPLKSKFDVRHISDNLSNHMMDICHSEKNMQIYKSVN